MEVAMTYYNNIRYMIKEGRPWWRGDEMGLIHSAEV